MLALASFFGFGEKPKATTETTSPKAPKRPRRRTIIPVTLKPGGLSRFGYSANNTTRSRHIALLRAAREEGFRPIIGRLNLIATFSRYRSPAYSRIFKQDQEWLSDYYAAVKEREGRNTRSRRKTRDAGPLRMPSRGLGVPPAAVTSNGLSGMGTLHTDDDDEDYTEDGDSDYSSDEGQVADDSRSYLEDEDEDEDYDDDTYFNDD